MEFINIAETLKMNIIEENTKAVTSPKITKKIRLSSFAIYKYVLCCLRNRDYDTQFKIQQLFRTIIRCVWKTQYTRKEYPDIIFINNINKHYGNVENNKYFFNTLFLDEAVMNIDSKTNKLNQDSLLKLHYSLFPSFIYNVNDITNKIFDQYLFIFKNILLANNVSLRESIKINKIERLSKASTEEEKKEIIREYEETVNTFKNEGIFTIVNYINYLYYNNISVEDALRTMLIRYSAINGNFKTEYFNELAKHDKQKYKQFIKEYYNKVLQNPNDTTILTEFYILINIYRYQFIDKDLSKYIDTYITTMIRKLTSHTQTIEEFEKYLYNNILYNYEIVSIFHNEETIVKKCIEIHYNLNSVKISSIHSLLMENVSPEIIKETDLENIYRKATKDKIISKLFNSMVVSNYEENAKELNEFSFDDLFRIFTTKHFTFIGPYTPIVLNYFIDRFGIDKTNEYIHEKAKHKSDDIYACLCCVLNDKTYYSMTINKDIFLIECNKYVEYMNDDIKEFIKENIINILRITKDSYTVCTLNETLDKL